MLMPAWQVKITLCYPSAAFQAGIRIIVEYHTRIARSAAARSLPRLLREDFHFSLSICVEQLSDICLLSMIER